MKLRNKKTGEIDDVSIIHSANKIKGVVEHEDGVQCLFAYTLEEFNEEWEDYEEPKECWYIDCDGKVYEPTRLQQSDLDRMEEIGNYFESKEEAEKAVEKLKAWQRLKDAGFKITGWANTIGDDYYKPSQIVIEMNNKPSFDEYDDIEPFKKDLDLLFGSEDS